MEIRGRLAPRNGRGVAFVAVLVVAAGCAAGEILADWGDPIDLRPADVVGVWRSGTDRAIRFAEDGTFAAASLPVEAFEGGGAVPLGFEGWLDGSGRWAVEVPRDREDGPKSSVVLSFERLAGTSVRMSGPDLTALRQDGVDRLYFFYIGDGGNSWTAYRR